MVFPEMRHVTLHILLVNRFELFTDILLQMISESRVEVRRANREPGILLFYFAILPLNFFDLIFRDLLLVDATRE